MKSSVVLPLLLVAVGFPIQGHPHYGRYHGQQQSTGPRGFPIQGYPYYESYRGHPQNTGQLGFPIQGYPYYKSYYGHPQTYTNRNRGNNYRGYKTVETEDQAALSFSSNSLPSSLSSVSGLLELLPRLTGSLPGAKDGSFSVDLGSIPGIEGTLTGSIKTSLTGAIEGSISGTISIMPNNDGKSRTTTFEFQDLEYILSGDLSDATAAVKAIIRAAMNRDILTSGRILSDLTSGSIFGTLNGSIIVSSTDETGKVDSKTYNFDKLAYKVDLGADAEDPSIVVDDSIAVGAFSEALREIAGDLGFRRA